MHSLIEKELMNQDFSFDRKHNKIHKIHHQLLVILKMEMLQYHDELIQMLLMEQIELEQKLNIL